jgi:undecaprenyl pyrophosphate phosphatase UppP
MSKDREQIVDGISGLATTIVAAYMRYVSEHRQIDNPSVLTAAAMFAAIIVDTLSFGEDDPSEEEMLTLLIDTTKAMLASKAEVRRFSGMILHTVLMEGRQ